MPQLRWEGGKGAKLRGKVHAESSSEAVARHPGRKRVYCGRGTVPQALQPGQSQPKTLAVVLRLLAETRAYAAKLEASAEALALELTHQENA